MARIGSGKTTAFLISMIEKLVEHSNKATAVCCKHDWELVVAAGSCCGNWVAAQQPATVELRTMLWRELLLLAAAGG